MNMYKRLTTYLIASISCLLSVQAQTSFLFDNNMAVFYPADFDSTQTLPSFAITKNLLYQNDVPETWEIRPVFGTTDEGKTLVEITFEEGTDLYGTGLVTGDLRRNGYDIPLWNNDNYGYYKPGLYQSHPWIMGVRPNGKTFGIIADNSWRSNINLSNPIKITSEGPSFRVIVIEKNNPMEMMQALSELTGHINLPPLWAIGYHQSRYNPSYKPSDVLYITNELRRRQHPCDVIWFDIDYMDGKRIFTYDATNYFTADGVPNPIAMNDSLHSKGFKAGYITDPGVKIDEQYSVYQEGNEGNYWVLNKDGEAYEGEVWPGMCHFPDFTRPETREWWGERYGEFVKNNDIDGAWNDMNEPGVFNTEEWTMPVDNQHQGGGGLAAGPHMRYHNLYGSLMSQATYEGIIEAIPEKRPFILSRANHLGAQRYCATWTGDNLDTWKHLKLTIPMCLNLGLSGQPFGGPDVGGYGRIGNADLMGHWFALAPYYPFSRNHTSEHSQEPWAFGNKIETVARNAINRRYHLLPYFYTLFHESSKTGMPIMRPLFFADVTNENLREEKQAFLLGKDLLIIPRWAVNPTLPQGDWDELAFETEDDGYQATVALRPGAILPCLGHTIQSTAEYTCDSITLYVNPLSDGNAEGYMYDDEGEGFDYKTGAYALLSFNCTNKGNDSLAITISQSEGTFVRPTRYFRVAVVGGEAIQYSDWSNELEIVVPNVLDTVNTLDTSKIGVYFIAGTFTNWFNGDEDKRLMLKNPSEDGTLTSDRLYFEAGTYEMKFANTENWTGSDWGAEEGNNSLTGTAIKGPDDECKNIKFSIEKDGSYYITFNPKTLQYAIVRTYESNQKEMYIGGTFNNWTTMAGVMNLVGDNQWEATKIYIPAGQQELKFANTYDFTGDDWGNAQGLSGTAVLSTGGDPNLSFNITTAGEYTIRFNDNTLEYSIELTSGDETGINENITKQTYIYPNPTNDLLNVNLNNGKGIVEIYAINGQIVLRKQLDAKSSTLHIAQLAKGTYLVKLLDGKETSVHKLIKD